MLINIFPEILNLLTSLGFIATLVTTTGVVLYIIKTPTGQNGDILAMVARKAA
ncbi:TPA: hypothetical protein ACF2PS_002196 [Legionella pneumophila]|uniref:hypothetical protein n=1 Tax=Legionella pneumophila TaxID=446 RepID=UPI0004AEC284|nr:hypothetical protein [Legionella pneumophila]MBG1728957.1 hypothetical protein [Legionella pneumophila]MCW8428542.1 hypothetical protein [Legionella pneumophila]HAT1866603.1 hypothetical protein [Legionella pneumophila]HAT1894142.1 hypothetical protein [Legionella pneumophila]HAT1915760.1 hypothetical protein [Legionella pneumophila]